METFLIKAAQLIVALSLLVVIHEFGHYVFARIFGIKVEKFYLFFNPWFSLAKWKPRPKKNGKKKKEGSSSWRDTEYGIGWVPLGGYVKIAGMIDESMDKEQMAQEPQPWEFRTKPAYQRLLVMTGGVLFNFIIAIVIYAGIAFHWGTAYVPFDKAIEGMDYVKTLQDMGFRNGDVPLMADGKMLDAADVDVQLKMLNASEVKVLRNHTDTVAIAIPSNAVMTVNKELQDTKGPMFMLRRQAIIARMQGNSPAEKAGMLEGDRIVKVGNDTTPSYTELTPALAKHKDKTVDIKVLRNGKEVVLPTTVNSHGKLGIQIAEPQDMYDAVFIKYGLLESIPKGWELGTTMLTNYVGSLKHLFTKEGAESIGGFGAIGDMFPDQWNWLAFWQLTAFLSIVLAIMNILPIPALDGGHVLFLIWEIVTRRKPSEKFLERAQMGGMIFLLLLLLYANGMDIIRAIF